MDFDSPDVAKEFPGLYMGEAGKNLNDPAEYDEDEKGKKKKDKKDSKKEKGYATLAGESSPEEEEHDAKSPGKAKKIKASFKLSAKKKDKKSIDKPDKERKNSDKDSKSKKVEKPEEPKSDKKSLEKEKIHVETKVEKLKDKKLEKDKEKKAQDKEKKAQDKEKKSSEKDKEKKAHEKDKEAKKEEKKKKKLSIGGDKDLQVKLAALVGSTSPSHAVPAAESSSSNKEKGLNLNQALNAFLNAPAPLLLKGKEKDHKKEKESSSTSSKVKLKLKRSKNSLEDSQSSQSDLSFPVSHQFPEEPEAIVKEIRKYETLLEQTHLQMKSSKKVSKKSEEQLWELQRTLTQLKRKLRSINALSMGSVPASVPTCPQPISIPAALLPPGKTEPSTVASPPASSSVSPPKPDVVDGTHPKPPTEQQVPPSLPYSPPSSSAFQPSTLSNEYDDMKLDFTLKSAHSPPPFSAAPASYNNDNSSYSTNSSNSSTAKTINVLNNGTNGTLSPATQEIDNLNVTFPADHVSATNHSHLPSNNKLSPNVMPGNRICTSDHGSSNSNMTSSLTPETELIERFQVEVQVHAEQDRYHRTPSVGLDLSDIERNDSPEFTSIVHNNSKEYSLSSSVIKTLTFSDDEDDDVNEEITDVSSLSLRNTNVENENSFLDEYEPPHTSQTVNMANSDSRKGSQGTTAGLPIEIVDPFGMPVFETEEYLQIENEALIFFNEELQEDIVKEETEIAVLMKQLEQMSFNGVDIDAPEIDLDLDQFDFDELVSLWQITKLENEALNDQVNHLRQMVAASKLEEFRLETRLKYLEEKSLINNGRNCAALPSLPVDDIESSD